MNRDDEMNLQDENMLNVAKEGVQNSEIIQTIVEIPRSQTQSEQNATLTVANQGTMGEEKNLGEPQKNPSLPPRSFTELSQEQQKNAEHDNMTLSQNQGVIHSTPLVQESSTRGLTTMRNELNGLLASNFLGPSSNMPLTMTRKRIPTLDQARASLANALQRAEQEIRASVQWETEVLPNVSPNELKNEIQEISSNIDAAQKAFEILAERLQADGIVNERNEKELTMKRGTERLEAIRARYFMDYLGAQSTPIEESQLQQIQRTPRVELTLMNGQQVQATPEQAAEIYRIRERSKL